MHTDGRVVALSLGVIACAATAGCERDLPTAAPSVERRSNVTDSSGAAAQSPDASNGIDTTYIASIELADDGGVDFVAGTVLARFTPGANAPLIAAASGARVRRAMLLPRAFVLDVPAGHERAVARALAHNPNVEFAELDVVTAVSPCEVGSCAAPDDPFIGYKWDLHNPGAIFTSTGARLEPTGAVDADIDWLEAFDYLGEFAGAAKIGIIDTGISQDHPDLKGRVAAARNFAFAYPDSALTMDRDGHGTHVSGIAAARGHNATGVSGVAYGANVALINAKACELYNVSGVIKTLCLGSATSDAIKWATDQGANVLNLSLAAGNPAATSGSEAEQASLQYARSKNVLPFCAAGNDNFPGIAFPARFPECVAVGATTWSDTRASYSNYGAQLALAAPGGDNNAAGTQSSAILSTCVKGLVSGAALCSATQYSYKTGTSMAVPQAAGLAALLFANGMTSANDVLARMENTADDLGEPGRDAQFGFGRINVYRAITGTSPNAPPVAAAGGPYRGDEGSAVAFDGSASSDPNGKPVTFAWSFGDGATATGDKPTHVYADNGSYTVTLAVTDQSGLTGTTTTTAEVTNLPPSGTFATSATDGRVVVGTPVTLSFVDVGDPSASDVATGITRAYSCVDGGGGATFTASPTCPTPNVGALSARGMLTDKDGAAAVYGPVAITVTAAATAVKVENVTGQYSDPVTLSASLSTNAGPGVATSPTGRMEFFVDGQSVGTQDVFGTGAVTHTIGPRTDPASSHVVTARFTSTDANYAASEPSTPATLTIQAESATLTYAAANVSAIKVERAGGTSPSFTLQVSVAEAQPDAPAGASLDGDINLAPVRMVLAPVGQGSSVLPTSCVAATAPGGRAARTYSCSFAAGIPVNTYAVQASVAAAPGGSYYVGSTEDVLTVYDPSLGYAAGGGSFAWPGTGERATFGFTIKYNNGGSNPQGSLLVVRYTADGATYRLKSNALDGLALNPAGGYATFSGKASYLEPGWASSKGNTSFTVYVEDNSELGAGADKFWLQVSGGMTVEGTASDNAQLLAGGNIAVPRAVP